MAANASSSKANQKLEDQLTCPVCLDQFTDPRTLPCLHSFCIQCLKRLSLDPKGDGKHSLFCPTCRTEVDLPQQGIDAFHKAFHLNNLIEVHQLMKKVNLSGSKSTICDNCKKVEAIGYCPECAMFFCPSCNHVHKNWHQTSSHKLIDIDQVTSKTAQMVSVKPEPVINCSSHNRPLDIYCVSCDQPICYLCTIKDHKGHNHNLIPDTYQNTIEVIEAMLDNLKQKRESISEIKESLQANLKKIEEQGDKGMMYVERLFSGLIQAVQRGKSLATQCVVSGMQCKMKFEEQQVKRVEVFLEALHYCQQHTEHSLKVDTPIQLLVTRKQLLSRLNTLVESDECDSIKPFEEFYEDFDNMTDNKIEEELSQVANDLTEQFIIPLSYSTKFYQQCYYIADLPDAVTQSVESTASFSILFQNEPVPIDLDEIKCSFQNSNKDGIICEVKYLVKDKNIKYQMKFTAEKPGNYLFILEVNQETIKSEKTYLKVLPA